MMRKKIVSFLLSAVMLAGVECPTELHADGYCCYDNSSWWCCYDWLIGGVLGAATGAAAGYAAGAHRGERGRRGKKGFDGPEGPQGPIGPIGPAGAVGPAGVEYNTTDPIIVAFTNLIEGGVEGTNTLEVEVSFAAETGETVGDTLLIDITTADGIIFEIPALKSKLVGDYFLVLRVITDSNPATAIGTFTFNDGSGPVPFTHVSGGDPSVVQPWFVGGFSVLRATFNP